MYTQRQADAIHGNVKLDENAGKRWLSKRGGDIKGMGVGYTMDVSFDRSKIRTKQRQINEDALRGKVVPKQTFKKGSSK